MERVKDPSDPQRCKAVFPHEQCWNRAAEGYDYCEVHGGRNNAAANERRIYQLQEVRNRQRLAELSGHEELKSLREEIGLARILVERRFEMIKSDTQLLEACGPINTMLLTI